ncbi:hypothetical protein V6N13_141065 [Hibiscus sabdariffa]
MAKKEIKKPSFLLLFALLLLVTARSRCTAEVTSSPTKTTRRKVLEMEQDYPGDVPSIPSDYDYNDFYRRQGLIAIGRALDPLEVESMSTIYYLGLSFGPSFFFIWAFAMFSHTAEMAGRTGGKSHTPCPFNAGSEGR